MSAANEWNIFQHSKRNFVSPRGHVISSIYFTIFIFKRFIFGAVARLKGLCRGCLAQIPLLICTMELTLKEQYPVNPHAPNFDFLTACREIKRCEESKRALKNPSASRLAEFNITLKLLRITDQWHTVPVKFRFGRNGDFFFALPLLPLARGPKDGKRVCIMGTLSL